MRVSISSCPLISVCLAFKKKQKQKWNTFLRLSRNCFYISDHYTMFAEYLLANTFWRITFSPVVIVCNNQLPKTHYFDVVIVKLLHVDFGQCPRVKPGVGFLKPRFPLEGEILSPRKNPKFSTRHCFPIELGMGCEGKAIVFRMTGGKRCLAGRGGREICIPSS